MLIDCFLQSRECGIVFQLLGIPFLELGPSTVWIGVKPLSQLRARSDVLVPHIIGECLVRKSTRPKAIDIDAETVVRTGLVVCSFQK